MIYDGQQLARDYAACYADKTRILFIEKYFSTFNATKGKKTQFHCFPRQRAFLKALSENRNVVAIKPRQCGITTLSSAWAAAACAFASKDAPETILCVANKLEQAQEIIIKMLEAQLHHLEVHMEVWDVGLQWMHKCTQDITQDNIKMVLIYLILVLK